MKRKLTILFAAFIILSACLAVPVFADGGQPPGDAVGQGVILAILFFVKIATAYLDYRKHGQFDFVPPAILFACLVFSLTCPLYLWKILGM